MTTSAARLLLARPPDGAYGEALSAQWWRGFAFGVWTSLGAALLGAGLWWVT
jgi:hypothetical protein